MCINESWSDGNCLFQSYVTPKFGQEYEVINCCYYKSNEYYCPEHGRRINEEEGVYYTLLGFEHEYHASNFSTLQSGVDERELVNTKEECL